MTHSIDLLLLFQAPSNLICLLQVFEVALYEMHLARIAVFLEFLHRLLCMFLLLRYQYDFCGIVLEEVGRYAEADASCPACHDVALIERHRVSARVQYFMGKDLE